MTIENEERIFEIDIEEGVINDIYKQYIFSSHGIRIFFGGSSSGKSWFALSQELPLSLLSGDRNYLVVRKVAATNRKSTYNQVAKGIEELGLSQYFKQNKSEQTITCRLNNRQVLFAGLDDVEKLKSITPIKGVITDILIEEATEIEKSDFKQLLKRLRGADKNSDTDITKRITFLFNPIFKKHWIYKEFFLGYWNDDSTLFDDGKKLIVKSTYKDNLNYLTDGDVELLENEKDEYWYNVYTLGNFGVLQGVVFKNWLIEDFATSRKFSRVMMGLDFGFTNDPTAFICCSVEGKRLYIWNEVYERGLQPEDIVRLIKPVTGRGIVKADSAEPATISKMNMLGVPTIGVKKSFTLAYRLQWLSQFELIVDVRCKNTQNELTVFSWRVDKYGEPSNEPEDRNNHSIDAIAYAMEDYMLENIGNINKMR